MDVSQDGIGARLRVSQNTCMVGATIWDTSASAMGRPLSSIFGLRNREVITLSWLFSLLENGSADCVILVANGAEDDLVGLNNGGRPWACWCVLV